MKVINFDTGTTKGITRKFDELGRVVIPKEFRTALDLKEKDEVEIYMFNDGFYLKKK